jgi:hypothetical protein
MLARYENRLAANLMWTLAILIRLSELRAARAAATRYKNAIVIVRPLTRAK